MSSPSTPSPAPAPVVVVPHQPTLEGRVLARLIWALAGGIAATVRWRLDDPSGAFSGPNPPHAIFAIWHNRQLLSPVLYRRFLGSRHPGRRLAALASASKDGAIAARLLEHFGGRPVRGSSSRRGAVALAELIDCARAGYDLAVTPDGPRGPKYRVQPGTVLLGQYTGLPMVPVSFDASWKRTLRSWDGFQIPLPFSRGVVRVGEALSVPRKLDESERAEAVAELERRLLAITPDAAPVP